MEISIEKRLSQKSMVGNEELEDDDEDDDEEDDDDDDDDDDEGGSLNVDDKDDFEEKYHFEGCLCKLLK